MSPCPSVGEEKVTVAPWDVGRWQLKGGEKGLQEPQGCLGGEGECCDHRQGEIGANKQNPRS